MKTKALKQLKELNDRLSSGEHFESVLDDIYDTDDETYADFNCETFSGTYNFKNNRISNNISVWELNEDNEIIGYLKEEIKNMETIKLIEKLYNKESCTTDLKYEIINVAQDSESELLDIVSRTKSDSVRFDIADLINNTNNDNVYVIELVEVRGALFVSTNYNETIKEWFKLTYLKEDE